MIGETEHQIIITQYNYYFFNMSPQDGGESLQSWTMMMKTGETERIFVKGAADTNNVLFLLF